MFSKWIEKEDYLDRVNWLPTISRETSESGFNDPERVILFEDIKDLMFRFTSEQLKIELLFHFLQFLGVTLRPGWCRHLFFVLYCSLNQDTDSFLQ